MSSIDPKDRRKPYGSARDLPSYQKMQEDLQAASIVTLFVARKQRSAIKGIKRDLEHLASTVDAFYDRLGNRNWVFNDRLPLDRIAGILKATDSAELAEVELIALYLDGDNLARWCLGFRAFEPLRAREEMIVRAREEYELDHFDTCTHLLISVMDGFVNDLHPGKRRGLHARESGEMVAWDSVVGHHLGLSHALGPFLKSIKKRRDEEVHDVYRNGIVHGSVVNYNNVVVATKAWNLLFAVVDWARAERNAEAPVEEQRTWREILERLAHNRDTRAALDGWSSVSYGLDDEGFADLDAFKRTVAFFVAWRDRNYGELTKFDNKVLIQNRSLGERAGEMRELFDAFELKDWSVVTISNSAPAVWTVRGEAIVNGLTGSFECRWNLQSEDGMPGFNVPEAELRLASCGPSVWQEDSGP